MHILHYLLIIGSKYLLYTWIEMRFNILLEENNRALKERDIFCFQTEGDCENQPMVCICISVSVGRKKTVNFKIFNFFLCFKLHFSKECSPHVSRKGIKFFHHTSTAMVGQWQLIS